MKSVPSNQIGVSAGGQSLRRRLPAELSIKILEHLFTGFEVTLSPLPNQGRSRRLSTLANICRVCHFFNDTATQLFSDRASVCYRDGDLLATMRGALEVFRQANHAALKMNIGVWNREIVMSKIVPRLESLRIDIPPVCLNAISDYGWHIPFRCLTDLDTIVLRAQGDVRHLFNRPRGKDIFHGLGGWFGDLGRGSMQQNTGPRLRIFFKLTIQPELPIFAAAPALGIVDPLSSHWRGLLEERKGEFANCEIDVNNKVLMARDTNGFNEELCRIPVLFDGLRPGSAN